MANFFSFIIDLFEKVTAVFSSIWAILTTTLNGVLADNSTGITWLDTALKPLLKVLGNWNLITLFASATIVIIIIRIVWAFFGR